MTSTSSSSSSDPPLLQSLHILYRGRRCVFSARQDGVADRRLDTDLLYGLLVTLKSFSEQVGDRVDNSSGNLGKRNHITENNNIHADNPNAANNTFNSFTTPFLDSLIN